MHLDFRSTAMETVDPQDLRTGLPTHRRLVFRLAVDKRTGRSGLSLPSLGAGNPFRTAGKK
jgi:hypothetical protein